MTRLKMREAAPATYASVLGLDAHINQCGLEKSLIELVKFRASQINHCTYCMDKHSKDARHGGETEQRLYVLSGWRESSLFSQRERAAMAWTECLTNLPTKGAPDADYAELGAHFSDREIGNLTVLIGLINLLNRMGVGFAMQHPVAA